MNIGGYMSYAQTSIEKLKDSGRFIFAYSDKRNVFFFFETSERKLYLVTTDKYLNIEYADEVDIPAIYKDYESIKFFKPYFNISVLDGNNHVFVGVITIYNKSYKFSVDGNKFSLGKEIDYVCNKQFNLLSCLKEIEIVSYIQKKNRLYLVGKDKSNDSTDPIYGVVDIEQDKFEHIYYMYTDFGSIELLTINTDVDDSKVYVAGYSEVYEDNVLVDTKPYVETFILRN